CLTTLARTFARSASSSRATAPVTTSAVSPFAPLSMKRSTTRRWLTSSISPASVNAVGIMEYTPWNAIKIRDHIADKRIYETPSRDCHFCAGVRADHRVRPSVQEGHDADQPDSADDQ